MWSIVVDNKEYKYNVGRTFVLVRCAETGERVLLQALHEIKGLTPDAFERGVWKKTIDGMVMPSDVERAIRATQRPD